MKNIWKALAGIALLASCQNELYIDPTEHGSEQGAYIATKGAVQIFVEEGKEYFIKDVQVGLAVKDAAKNNVTIEAGNQAQLDAYNKKNSTSYLMLPEEMYEIPATLDFQEGGAKQILPVNLKNIKFSLQGDYALPVRLTGANSSVIPGEDEAIIVLEKLTRTKVLLMKGSEIGSDKMFPADFKVPQWTMEVMINRDAYTQNNQAIAGTKTVQNSGPIDEIYTRFGDVTIKPNQLQIKTGASQIDVDEAKFAAKPGEWYMLSFVYDGKNTRVYVNGDLVAEQQIREGSYGLVGFWLSGCNKFVREVRFWDIARNAKQIKEYVWKMVNPDSEGLLLYYPCNGKKRDIETGEITNDGTHLWNWASYYKGDRSKLDLYLHPDKGSFDDNGGKLYTFPLQD